LKQFGLSAKERIKSKKEFDVVYSAGQAFYSSSNKLKAVVLIQKETEEAVLKTAFAVSRKSGNAVWRNRVKRLLRESFRFNKQNLKSIVELNKIKLFVVLSPNTINQKNKKKIVLSDLQTDVIDLLNQIKVKL
jgi:ribonuclease P protein component